MKVIMMCKTKILPGKMAEYMELEKKMFGITEDAEAMPPYKRLMLMSGTGDMQHTITYLFEFDNFAAMDKWVALASAPEFMALMPKFDSVMASHEHDVFMEAPLP
jgi:antibiotic biosynthesis monooxygenase (ABM) superfamily enzyme